MTKTVVARDFPSTFTTIALQNDSKVLIGGWFYRVNDFARPSLARLKGDGSLDSAFSPGLAGPYPVTFPSVNSIEVLADGRILLSGYFGTFREGFEPFLKGKGIARLNPDGTFDPGFNVGLGTDVIRAIAWQSDGKVFIAGDFISFSQLKRLTSNDRAESQEIVAWNRVFALFKVQARLNLPAAA